MVQNAPTPRAYSYLRYSSPQQRRGDSMRRQTEKFLQWCQVEGGGLPADYTLRDPALSAYRGRNAKVGALARFFGLIEAGRIAPGSVLVIENLDRLSRNEPLEGLVAMRQIVSAGVDIVTLLDRQRYTRDKMRDLSTLIQAVAILSRGFEESDTKSQRLSEKWAEKRKAAQNGIPVTVRCPPWLKVTGSKLIGTRRDWTNAKFEVIPERAAIVEDIFNQSIEGWGYRRIALNLKRRKVPFWGRAPWSPSTVCKLIKARSVLGEFQPCVYVGGAYGKRQAEGKPIRNYFPRIISDEKWEQAQPNVTQHRHGARTALLSGLLRDPAGKPMHYVRTGFVGHRVGYVQTADARLEPGERAVRWRAEHLERCVIAVTQGIDWERVLLGRAQEPAVRRLRDEIARTDREEAALLTKISNAANAFTEGKLGAFGDALRAQIARFEADLTAIRARRASSRTELEALRQAAQVASDGISTIRSIPTDPEAIQRLNAELRAALSNIQVWPDGKPPGDKLAKQMRERALALTSPRARIARKKGRIIGAFRLTFATGKAITVYSTYMPGDRKLRAEIVGFSNPSGLTMADWAETCDYAALRLSDEVEFAVTG